MVRIIRRKAETPEYTIYMSPKEYTPKIEFTEAVKASAPIRLSINTIQRATTTIQDMK